MTYQEFITKYDELNQAMGHLPMSSYGSIAQATLDKEQDDLIAANRSHYDGMVSANKAEAAAERAAAERAAVERERQQADRPKSSNTDITPQKSEPSNFKNLFLNYIPKAAVKVYTDDEVKTKLLKHQPGPGSSFILKIPDFNGMTDDKYKNLIDILDNLHQRGLFDEYKSIVKDLYNPDDSSRTTFRQMDWMAMFNSDKDGKTNLLPTIKLLNTKLGQDNNKILRKTDKDENVYTGKFVEF